jgi:hypothetical protein
MIIIAQELQDAACHATSRYDVIERSYNMERKLSIVRGSEIGDNFEECLGSTIEKEERRRKICTRSNEIVQKEIGCYQVYTKA